MCAVIFVFLYLKDLFKKIVVQILINRLQKNVRAHFESGKMDLKTRSFYKE